jgi:hydrogenase maturation protease
MSGHPHFLIYGYGNPGRLDDGLGPACATAIEAWDLPSVQVEQNYQLQLEDSHIVAGCDVAIFVDASVQRRPPFYVERLTPRVSLEFTSHSVDPATVVGLAGELFNVTPHAFLIGIPGYEFNDFGEGLSDPARAHLNVTLDFLRDVLEHRDVDLLDARAVDNRTPAEPSRPILFDPQTSCK